MGASFSEEFLMGYQAGHRDGFADAVLLMRDVTTPHRQAAAMASREAQIERLLSGETLDPPHDQSSPARRESPSARSRKRPLE